MSDEIPASYPVSPQHFRKVLGMLVSTLILLSAVIVALMVKENIRINPRTEDAQVRANVVGVAAQVGGSITAIHVKDNQPVRKGDLLFELDERPYAAELDKAKAQLALTELEINAYKDQITSCEAALRESEANALYASNYAKRIQALVGSNYVTTDKNELAQTQAQTTAAKVEQDKAALERAKNLLGDSGNINVRRVAAQAAMRDAALKLSYCKVYAPCDGYVTNLQITLESTLPLESRSFPSLIGRSGMSLPILERQISVTCALEWLLMSIAWRNPGKNIKELSKGFPKQ